MFPVSHTVRIVTAGFKTGNVEVGNPIPNIIAVNVDGKLCYFVKGFVGRDVCYIQNDDAKYRCKPCHLR